MASGIRLRRSACRVGFAAHRPSSNRERRAATAADLLLHGRHLDPRGRPRELATARARFDALSRGKSPDLPLARQPNAAKERGRGATCEMIDHMDIATASERPELLG